MNPTVPLSCTAPGRPVDRATWWMKAMLVAMAIGPVLPTLNAETFLPLGVRLESLALWILCLAPGWAYASTTPERRAPLPFLAVFGVVYGAYFALPLALGLTDLAGFGSYLQAEDYAVAADAAMLGWAGLLSGLALTIPISRGATPAAADLRPDVLLAWAKAFAGLGALIDLLLVTVSLPTVIQSTATFGQTLGRFGLALGILLLAKGLGRRSDALILAGCAAVTALALLSSGSLSGLLFLGVTIGFGAWAGRGGLRKRELLAAIMLVLTVVAVRGVSADFRAVAWFGDRRLSLTERVSLMASLVEEQVQGGGQTKLFTDGADAVGERSAAATLLADVIQRTPSEVPYWRGETYVSLVGALVPRLIWPDKPEKNLGQRFGHRYSYLSPLDTSTSINMPWLVEFYANFGMGFVPIGGTVVGLILGLMGWILNRPDQEILTTVVGITLLVPLYNVENDFSLIFGGLVLYGAALAVVVRWLRRAASVQRSRPHFNRLPG